MRTLYVLFLSLLLLLTGCNQISGNGQANRVGMLVETTIHDQAWGQQGYKGLQSIQDEYGVDIYFKEGIKSYSQTVQAVDHLVNKGVNIIFGHSNIYGKHFQQLHKQYPDVQFIYFNGQFSAENVTSLNFSANAMGFFAGMVAGKMTEADLIGIIASFEWQPEIEGFYEGVMYQNSEADVHIAYTNSWENTEKARMLYEQMEEEGVDVFYPAGDIFNVPVINEVQKDGHYAIGYVSDQSSVAENTVLTSTVQKVDVVYNLAMDRFVEGELPGKPLTFDFQDGAIKLGEYSPEIPESFQKQMDDWIEQYMKTGKLPNE
ncbi:BMP family ABC transporter substrate-binding protein [Halobacillus mangrovi]|uniref:BMP family ABC transporter substrate-binding protein n=1 Tax=Halobacillus mangrovi TaxID=402384 RepID=UPI003D965191